MQLVHRSGQQIDVIVRVIADRMAGRGNLLKPIDVRLFEHPADRKRVRFEAPLPDDMKKLIARLRRGEDSLRDGGTPPATYTSKRPRPEEGRQKRSH